MVMFFPGSGEEGAGFQYSLCRVVLMVFEKLSNRERAIRSFSTRSVESF